MAGEAIGVKHARLSRRRLVAAAAPLLVAGCASVGPAPLSPHAGDDGALLNAVLGLEYEALAAYDLALAAGVLAGAERDLALAFQSDHRRHAEALARVATRLGAKPVEAASPAAYGFTAAAVAQRDDALAFLVGVEEGLTLAHLGGVPAFADKDLAKSAAGLVGVEAMHWASWRRARGEAPVPTPFLG